MEVTVEREHSSPPEALFEQISSLQTISRFVGMQGAAYRTSQARLGAVFTVREVDMFRKDRDHVDIEWTVTAFTPPTRFRAESSDGGILDFVLTRTGTGTHVAMTELDAPSDADAGFDRFLVKAVAIVPPLARKLATGDAMKNLRRI